MLLGIEGKEIGLTTRRNDEEVVEYFPQRSFDGLVDRIHVFHLSHAKLKTWLTLKNFSQRVCDRIRLQAPGSYLIEQGLEGVIILAVKQCYIELIGTQFLVQFQACKPSTYDHYSERHYVLRCFCHLF